MPTPATSSSTVNSDIERRPPGRRSARPMSPPREAGLAVAAAGRNDACSDAAGTGPAMHAPSVIVSDHNDTLGARLRRYVEWWGFLPICLGGPGARIEPDRRQPRQPAVGARPSLT